MVESMILPDNYIDGKAARYLNNSDTFAVYFDNFHEFLMNIWLIDCGGLHSNKFTAFRDGDLVEHSITAVTKQRIISMVVGPVLVDENGVPVCTTLIAENPEVVGHVP